MGEISRKEKINERGMLSAIVVHKKGDFMPGKGFFKLAKSLGYEKDDVETIWIAEIKKIFNHK